ncbi:Na+/melibiose symporter-like transporter [Rhizobium sp. PP-F2F-G48]|nr:Na+/melibiose symporter-like transporter [Rhizobium sp. PP-F2F-G48]
MNEPSDGRGTTARHADAKLPVRILLAYALPAAPLAALGLPLYSLVPTYYTETLGVPIATAGWVILLIRLFDAVSDPLVGYAADRMDPAFGRRRLLFLLSLPVAALAAMMLYWPAETAGAGWLGVWGCVVSLGFTMAMVPYSAWGAELVGDYHGRTRLSAFRETFTLMGTLIAIILPFAIGFEQKGLSGLAVLGILVGIGLLVLGGLTVRMVPEPANRTQTRLSLPEALRFLVSNKPFLRLVLAYFLNGLANGIPATLFLYFVSARLGLPEMRGPLLFLYFLCAIAGIPLASACASRFGKHRAWAVAMLVACAVFLLAPFLALGSLYGFGAICVVTGILLGFDLALPPSIQADVIDADTAVSGEQRGGFYFAAWGLATKLSLAIGAGLVFPLLSAAGFDPARGAGNTPGALFALAVLYAWVPVVLKLCAIALMWTFPLDERMQRQLREAIDPSA